MNNTNTSCLKHLLLHACACTVQRCTLKDINLSHQLDRVSEVEHTSQACLVLSDMSKIRDELSNSMHACTKAMRSQPQHVPSLDCESVRRLMT